MSGVIVKKRIYSVIQAYFYFVVFIDAIPEQGDKPDFKIVDVVLQAIDIFVVYF